MSRLPLPCKRASAFSRTNSVMTAVTVLFISRARANWGLEPCSVIHWRMLGGIYLEAASANICSTGGKPKMSLLGRGYALVLAKSKKNLTKNFCISLRGDVDHPERYRIRRQMQLSELRYATQARGKKGDHTTTDGIQSSTRKPF